MLTCADTHERLALLVAGEDSSEALREHLAACDDCRAERDRTARDIEALRESLASLSPSPFLADEVAKAAHGAAPVERPAKRHLWIGAGVALAAASLLFGVLAAIRAGVFVGAGPADGDAVAWVAPPPSARMVDEVRSMAAQGFVWGNERMPLDAMRHEGHRKSGFVFDRVTIGEKTVELPRVAAPPERSTTFLPPREGDVHRWVYGDKDGLAGKRTFTMGADRRDGVMLVGMGLIGRLGKTTLSFDGGTLLVAAGERTWKGLPGTSEAELVVSAPYEGGAEARVRVLVSTGYSGGLLLEEPLARALDLHHFEIPGGFEIQNTGYHGQRARARVRIAELGVDVVTEVQVLARSEVSDAASFGVDAGGPLVFGGLLPPERAPLARDADPASAAVGVAPAHGAPRTFRVVARHAADAPAAAVTTSTYDAVPTMRERTFRVSWLRVQAGAAPGSRVVLARAWRGTDAIPTREGVAWAVVGADGSADVPRIAGEVGSTLRMLVIPPKGEPVFRDVDLDARAIATVQAVVRADGVSLAFASSKGGEPKHQSWTASAGGRPDTTTMEELVHHTLEQWAGEEGLAGAAAVGTSVRMVVRPVADVPWDLVRSLLQAAARAGILHVEYAEPGRLPEDPDAFVLGPAFEKDLVRQDVPRDAWIAVVDTIVVRVVLDRPVAGGPVQTRVFSGEEEVLGATSLEDALWNASSGLRQPEPEFVTGEIDVPVGAEVPYSKVRGVLRAMHAVGIVDVTFRAAKAARR